MTWKALFPRLETKAAVSISPSLWRTPHAALGLKWRWPCLRHVGLPTHATISPNWLQTRNYRAGDPKSRKTDHYSQGCIWKRENSRRESTAIQHCWDSLGPGSLDMMNFWGLELWAIKKGLFKQRLPNFFGLLPLFRKNKKYSTSLRNRSSVSKDTCTTGVKALALHEVVLASIPGTQMVPWALHVKIKPQTNCTQGYFCLHSWNMPMPQRERITTLGRNNFSLLSFWSCYTVGEI